MNNEAARIRLSWDEAARFAQLVAQHWQRGHRNPTAEECRTMAMTAIEMTANGATLQ